MLFALAVPPPCLTDNYREGVQKADGIEVLQTFLLIFPNFSPFINHFSFN